MRHSAEFRLKRISLGTIWLAAGVAGAGILTASPGAVAGPSTGATSGALRGGFSAPVQRRALRPRTHTATPVPCSTNYPGASFVGISGQLNVAGGEDSSVLGGYDNMACSEFSGVGAGYLNNNSGNGSFIAGGDYQAYSYQHPYGNSISGADSFIGAGDVNGITGSGSFIGAGGVYYESIGMGYAPGNAISGTDSFVGAGDLNRGDSNLAFIGAGYDNEIQGPAVDSFIGAGADNVVMESYDFVGGGSGIEVSAPSSVGVGGTNNRILGSNAASVGGNANVVSGAGAFAGAGGTTSYGSTVSGTDAFAGAGDQNSVAGNWSFDGGGGFNTIAPAGSYAVLAGGAHNMSGAQYAAVLGGYGNSASGSYAVIAGGDGNKAAGTLSFAAGYKADAAHDGSFVWSDYQSGSPALADSAANQFVVRASGGTYVYSSENLSAGVMLAAGSGTWASLSDRNAKTDVVPLDDASILAKVAALPVSGWRYKSETGVRHVGPMAQDFYAAFGVGTDDRHITSIDEDGVALAAIKALHRENAALYARVNGLVAEGRRRDADLGAMRVELRRMMAAEGYDPKRR